MFRAPVVLSGVRHCGELAISPRLTNGPSRRVRGLSCLNGEKPKLRSRFTFFFRRMKTHVCRLAYYYYVICHPTIAGDSTRLPHVLRIV